MNLVLYRKWRPQTWDDVVGQRHVIRTLAQAVASGRTAHAYLFSGPRGTGKTSMARILAKAVNCLNDDPAKRPCNECAHCLAINEGTFLDLIEIDAASNTSVEDIRDLRERVLFTPAEGRFKVYIIDEVHMLSTAAFNALLKTLEEPPAHVLFVLATTEAHKIPATVVSRCQRHEFRRLGVEEMVVHLEKMAKEEGLQAERAALEMVARQATGSMRDAVSLLDQLGSLGEPITLQRALDVLGAAANESVQRLAACIASGDTAGGLKILHEVMDSGADARQFARQLVDFLRGVMMAGSGNADLVEATGETRANMKALAAKLDPGVMLRAIRAFSLAASDSRSGWRPQLPLELAIMDATLAPLSEKEPDAGRSAGGPSKPAAGFSPQGQSPSATGKPPARTLSSASIPAARPAPIPSAKGTEPATGPTLARIVETWPRIMAGLRERDSRTHALFSACQVRSIEGDVLSLAVPSDLIQQKCSRLETLTMLQGVLAEVLGQAVRIRCVVDPKTVANGPAAPGSVQYTRGGMMDVATNELGAHVIDLP